MLLGFRFCELGFDFVSGFGVCELVLIYFADGGFDDCFICLGFMIIVCFEFACLGY